MQGVLCSLRFLSLLTYSAIDKIDEFFHYFAYTAGKIVGCLTLSDAPPVVLASGSRVSDWLKIVFAFENLNRWNTLFIQLIVVDEAHQKYGFIDIIRTADYADMIIKLDNFDTASEKNVLRMRFNSFISNDIKPIYAKYPPTESGKCEVRWDVAHFRRRDFDPALNCRIASIKDNDYVTPMLNSRSNVLQELYGEFYIAELVSAQNDEMKAFVLESSDSSNAVGFMSVTTNFDCECLCRQYDLQAFNYLRKQIDEEKLERKTDREEGNWTRRHLEENFNTDFTLKMSEMLFIPESNNAVVIQLFGLLPKYDHRFRDFLVFMFDQFPGIDYAVISVPRLEPETSLLREFCRVKPRLTTTVTQELYVYHRMNLISDFKVRLATRKDLDEILELAQSMHHFDQNLFNINLKKYMEMTNESDGTALFCYVTTCLDKVVGVLFARAERNINWLRANYDLEDYIYFMQHGSLEFATIIHFLLSSNAQSRAKLFIREVMRQAGKSCFFYYVYPPWSTDNKLKINTPLPCLADFYPVRPRRQIIYPAELLNSEKAPQNSSLTCELDNPPPAVYLTTRNLLMEPKIVVNARIIVVGASSTGLAFLEQLAFSRHIRFNNLVLLSPNGLPEDTESPENPLVSLFFPERFRQDRRRLGQLSLRTITHVISGTLTAINRKRKVIMIDNRKEISYDFIILTPGMQYHPSIPIGIDTDYTALRRQIDNCERILITTKHKASNLFLLNDKHSTLEAINYVKKHLIPNDVDQQGVFQGEALQTSILLEDPESDNKFRFKPANGPIIVYGNCVDAYVCVNGLLQMGVSGYRIIMLHPAVTIDSLDAEDESHVTSNPFEDIKVESAVHKEIEHQGVRVFKNCRLVCWNNDPTALYVDEIESATFLFDGIEKRVPCVAFFPFVEKKIDYDFFKAVNDACLVFDKRLVIDTNFRTSDPCIRAAGPATKYPRILYNDKFTHGLFNSLEIGEKLGDSFLKEFDPSIERPGEPPKDDSHLLPQFEMPRIVYAKLPGDYTYLHIWPPGYKKNFLLRQNDPDFGKSLVTGCSCQELNYFRIHIDDLNRIDRIVCLSRKSIPISNYFWLYATHEKLVNNLVSRYEEGLIKDFYSFFEEPWAMALFHDRFNGFKEEIHELCCNAKDVGHETLIDFVRRFTDPSEKKVSEETLERIHLEHLRRSHKAEIEKRTIDFIANNYDLLPMYAKPDMIKQVN
nr:hypothetical transcript [Hymenolepis microstoma]